MDNRDANIKCPFYRPGSKAFTTNARVIGKRKRTINCSCGEGARISLEFRTVEERVNYCKTHCKQNWRACKVVRIIEEQKKEEER